MEFALRRSSRRKTIEITVERGGDLQIAAPGNCPTDAIASFVRNKKTWIYSKLLEKEQRLVLPAPKQFVTGEGFPYLGKSYRLLLVESQAVPLKLEHGRFKLPRDLADEGRTHLIRWYTDHARRRLHDRVGQFAARVGVSPRAVEVRDLGFRWGSCSPSARLNFHWRVAMLPPSIGDYIVVHELVHLAEPHHGSAFWSRVEQVLPDWMRRKIWLAEHGAGLMI